MVSHIVYAMQHIIMVVSKVGSKSYFTEAVKRRLVRQHQYRAMGAVNNFVRVVAI